MSSKIHLLPESLINKIAAGEVVERPASVVKELLENSLDAQASKVKIELEAGGKRLVSVSDNGIGMSPDDALLSLERHATSKLKREEDLFAISSLGFRGEALPSISAVSKLVLRTRDQESELGSEIRVEGGVIKEVRKIAMPVGTSVEVRTLFYNVPARREFLKSTETELGHIIELVTKIALSHPEISFELYHHHKNLLQAPSVTSYEHRAQQLLGTALAGKLIKVENEIIEFSDQGPLRLFGLISPAELTFSTTRHLYLYINRRYVRDKILTHSILEAYRTMIPKNRYPAVILFLEMPASLVDVNVHPTKLEVRFREPGKVHQAIFELIQSAFRAKPQFLMPEFQAEDDHKLRVEQAVQKFFAERVKEPSQSSLSASSAVSLGQKSVPISQPEVEKTEAVGTGISEPGFAVFKKQDFFSQLRVIGQFHSNYLILESEDELIIIDQHAVHERINFEKLKSQLQENQISQQILLFPQVVELDFHQTQLLRENLELIRKIGFEIEIFGSTSFLVKAVPYLLQEARLNPFFTDLSDELAELGRSKSWEEKMEQILSVVACHSSVRAGQVLSEPEIKALLKEMDQSPYVKSCPHGRPALWKISLREIEKKFQR